MDLRWKYRIADLKHRSRSGSLIAAHDVFHNNVARLLFCSENGSAHYGGELDFGEVLRSLVPASHHTRNETHLTGIANLEETGTAIEN